MDIYILCALFVVLLILPVTLMVIVGRFALTCIRGILAERRKQQLLALRRQADQAEHARALARKAQGPRESTK